MSLCCVHICFIAVLVFSGVLVCVLMLCLHCSPAEWKPSEPLLPWHRWCDGGVLPKPEVCAAVRTNKLLTCHQPCGQVNTHTHTHTHTLININININTHTHTPTQTHIHTHKHTHNYKHTNTYTHTHTQQCYHSQLIAQD